MSEQKFQAALYKVVYLVAFVYYLGFYLRELLPSEIDNSTLALPFKVFHAVVVFPLTNLALYGAVYCAVSLSVLGRELIQSFSLPNAWQTVRTVTHGYVTRLVHTIK